MKVSKETRAILEAKFSLDSAKKIEVFAEQTTVMFFGLADVVYMKLLELKEAHAQEMAIFDCKKYLAQFLGISINDAHIFFSSIIEIMLNKYDDAKNFEAIKNNSHFMRFVAKEQGA